MNSSYDLIPIRNQEYFKNEEFEDWGFGKEGEACLTEYFTELKQYDEYKNGAGKNIDHIGTGLKLLREGKSLSHLKRQDFVNLIAQFFKIDGWVIYFPTKIHNLGINILIEKKINAIEYMRYVIMIRKNSYERKVSPRDVRELDCLVDDSCSSKGIIVTTGDFSSGALKVIKKRSGRIFPVSSQTLERDLLRLSYREIG